MFGIERKLEDPLRSGRMMFFSLETIRGSKSFVNNVWYIKILSPEDIQKMGEQVESVAPSSGQRLNGTGAESHIDSGSASIGSLEY
ncbi:hypothetical protein Lalb_Chr20g0117171 [Lupinus albus]|uniref:Uncharacterized protein n=1 Tax=Lupinus albus TaxID=3870 RepID=A0A6A4NP88_LUPAL|nr:hypothetical protein Lalb_Chr20g0117171 [Lupinus albus]